MFGFRPRQFTDANMLPRLPLIEPLEDRQLLSATVHPATAHTVKADKAVHAAKTHAKADKANKADKADKASHKKAKTKDSDASTASTGSTGSTGTTSLPNIPFTGQVENTITFSQAPSAVNSGLTSLASTDGLAPPTSSQTVYLGNSNGVETYSLHYSSTGESSTITVDENGNPVTKPTATTTTYSDLSAADSAAAAEIAAIATALNLTAPTDSTTVNVTTTSSGAVTYSVHLSYSASTSSSSTTGTSTVADFNGGGPAMFAGAEISVDSAGNPVSNQRLPFDVLPADIQSAINANAPTGASTLATSSTQSVGVQTIDGVTLYTTTFNYSGTTTNVTVNEAGTLTSLPSTTTTTFSTLSSTVQSELQTLATADGVTTAISSTQSVTVYAEPNGTVIYSVSLSTGTATPVSGGASSTSGYGNFSDTITIAVDANGNPTVPPRRGIGLGGGAPGPIGGPIPILPVAFS
ncbi:MAG TPA: hypothetical protein VHY37_05125 [Tepidisphaeraceae bacterium]|nr:hypothetical protein [Tepidisphaeraceae bacterium]